MFVLRFARTLPFKFERRCFTTQSSALPKSRILYSEFNNRNVIVTGAGQGIGQGICHRLEEQNANVIAISKTMKNLDSLPAKYNKICVDLSDVSNIRAVIADILSAKPDFLVNSAGISIAVDGNDKFLNLEYEQGLRKVHSVNFDSVFYLSQQICKYWKEENIAGRIVNISSIATKITLAEHIAYTTSKYALDALTKTMAMELGEFGIRVNAVNPTIVLTPMAKQVWFETDGVTPTEAGKELMKNIPLGRFFEIDEIVDVIFFLLSDSASMIHGQLIALDGGLTC